MKILILVTTIIWSFGGGNTNDKSFVVVDTSEEAAIYIYRQQPTCAVEPDQKEYNLYEVDLSRMMIKEVDIPELTFK